MAKKNESAAVPQGSTKWFQPSKPNFVKLRENSSIEGIYQGLGHSQYGPCYKFRDDNGEFFSLGGNRAQIDQLFAELAQFPEGFIGDTIVGHYLIVARGPNTVSKSGRRVAVYQIGHVFEKCPKGCKPIE